MVRFRFLVLVFALIASPVDAGMLADLEVFDATARRSLPLYHHEGRLYVAGEPKHRYELRIRSRSGRRLLAVTSVDGVNVIDGKTAAARQSGYVLDPWSEVTIDGWRKSLDDVATFYFTRLSDSYAARTGRPENVGVIGVALFREATHLRQDDPRLSDNPEPRQPDTGDKREQAAEQTPSGQAPSAPSLARRSDSRLGTGHGDHESSPAQYVDFRRASPIPDETLVIYYDSYTNLAARGVAPADVQYSWRSPQPFPDSFVPDTP